RAVSDSRLVAGARRHVRRSLDVMVAPFRPGEIGVRPNSPPCSNISRRFRSPPRLFEQRSADVSRVDRLVIIYDETGSACSMRCGRTLEAPTCNSPARTSTLQVRNSCIPATGLARLLVEPMYRRRRVSGESGGVDGIDPDHDPAEFAAAQLDRFGCHFHHDAPDLVPFDIERDAFLIILTGFEDLLEHRILPGTNRKRRSGRRRA